MSAKSGAKRLFTFMAGIFILVFIFLGYESNQFNLLGSIISGFFSGVYGIVGFFEGHQINDPISQKGAVDFVTAIGILMGISFILIALFSKEKSKS